MDSIGSLELAWAHGYDGSVAQYINRDVICFKCGNKIKFVGEDGHESVFPTDAEGMGPLAVHGVNHVFAFASQTIDPTVWVYQYPSFRLVAELKGGATLEYTKLVFSSSDFLASISGVPDYQLTVWRFTDGTRLCTSDLAGILPNSITFNPSNWRQLFTSNEKTLTLWQIEQSHDLFRIEERKLKLPAVVEDEEEPGDRDLVSRASTRTGGIHVDVPLTAVAGIKGDEAARFAEYQNDKERVAPITHCWTASGDVLVGCKGGQLLKVDEDTAHVKILYNPGPRATSAISRAESAKSMFREESGIEFSASNMSTQDNVISEGSLSCLALHRRGVYAAGADGMLRLLDIRNDTVQVAATLPLGVPVTSLSFNPAHHHLAVGSDRGSLHLYDPDEPNNVKCLFDVHFGTFVGVGLFSNAGTHCVSLREDGEVQVWQIEDAKLVASFSVGYEATSLACSPLTHVVVVGTASGHIYFLDLNNLETPRIIQKLHVHQGPVKQMEFNESGLFLLTGSDDGHVFVLEGRPSKGIEPLGYIDVAGEIKGLSTFHQAGVTKVAVTANTTEDRRVAATKLVHFDLPDDLSKDVSRKHASLKCDFADKAVKKLAFNLASPSFGLSVGEGHVAFTLCQKSKEIHKLTLPTHPPKKDFSKDSFLRPISTAEAHQLAGGVLRLSPHGKWLASCGADGRLCVKAVGALERTVTVQAHDYQAGGAVDLAFSADSCQMFTAGKDGTLTCYKWNFTTAGQSKAKAAADAARSIQTQLRSKGQAEDEVVMAMPEWSPGETPSRPGSGVEKADQEIPEKSQELDPDQIYSTPTPVPSADATWLEAKRLQALKEEDKQYSTAKKTLRTEIRDMRKKLLLMMRENEEVPDLEKLGHHDFDLDVEEQARLQAAGEAEVERIREEKEFENLAKMYLADLIRTECWDEMETKGRGIKTFNGANVVDNYPMKARSPAEKATLEKTKILRQLEMTELAARKDIAEFGQKKKILVTKSKQKKPKTMDDDLNEAEETESGEEKPSTTGSLGAQFGGGSDLFYSQFELHTRERKMRQIVLLEDAIHRIKTEFNKQFDITYEKKENEIAKVREKNRRIKKILSDLDLQETSVEVAMGPEEKPELLLTVSEDEVTVEKFLTAEQQKQKEAEEKLEEERRMREKGDNWRDRGLDMMMGGVLEIKKEDELKKDVPVPPFMQAKPEEEWTEDEKRMALEYDKKVKDLTEEREKYRKQLEMELRKLQSMIQDAMQQFDETLNQLFVRKIKTEMVIYQEELKISRLRYMLLLEEELKNYEEEMLSLLDHKKQLKTLSGEAAAESKKNVDTFREEFEILQVEDKVLDKNFKKEFSDVPALQTDQLYKLYRRRPRGQKARGADAPVHDPTSGNPFAERPSTAHQHEMAQQHLETSMAELDRASNAPEGVEPHIWERLCEQRRMKIESEQLVKQKALVFADMQAFASRRQQEDDTLRDEIEDLTEAINKLKTNRHRLTCNQEVQLLLKQGQVEVEATSFTPDYRSSLLLHRGVVEELNSKIRQLGESKIASMVESKDFRKGIIQLEWEHSKMTMEMEDLQNKMRDIQNLKVTREIQAFLNEHDHDSKKSQEIATMEQTLVLLKQHQERNVGLKRKVWKELKRTVQDKAGENERLSRELEGINVSVNEMKHIHEVNADKRTNAGTEERYREIVQRRKLVDLAKAQAQEVAVLRAEVERLRMRTFPALVQVEH